MIFEAKCQATVRFNGTVKVLLTVESAAPHDDEHVLLNILSSRGPLEQGKTYRITIEELP